MVPEDHPRPGKVKVKRSLIQGAGGTGLQADVTEEVPPGK
jgi:hypothetical protein